VTGRLIRITTARAAVAAAGVAATRSCQHACESVRSRGESGVTARLPPFAVDGLIWPRPWWWSAQAAGTALYHDWPRGALALASSRRSVPAWRTAWARAGRCPGQRMAGAGADRFVRAFTSCCSSGRAIGPAPGPSQTPRETAPCQYWSRACGQRNHQRHGWIRPYERRRRRCRATTPASGALVSRAIAIRRRTARSRTTSGAVKGRAVV
jgi:hypothetical protein